MKDEQFKPWYDLLINLDAYRLKDLINQVDPKYQTLVCLAFSTAKWMYGDNIRFLAGFTTCALCMHFSTFFSSGYYCFNKSLCCESKCPLNVKYKSCVADGSLYRNWEDGKPYAQEKMVRALYGLYCEEYNKVMSR